jgi:uncharacterized Fe-S cluster protein YjdI
MKYKLYITEEPLTGEVFNPTLSSISDTSWYVWEKKIFIYANATRCRHKVMTIKPGPLKHNRTKCTWIGKKNVAVLNH